ncbi:MAG: NAD-dependent epimerase/dehydratase family protein [Candidatus Thorarchaeota archaeon]
MHALITGASGFLGSHIVEELHKNDYSISVLVRKTSKLNFLKNFPKIKIKYGDLTDFSSIQNHMQDIDTLFHNGSVVDEWGKYSYFKKNNVIGTKNILDAVLNSNIKNIVYTSTADFYSDSLEAKTESAKLHPRGNYQKSKIEAEKIISLYEEQNGLKVTKIRPPGILGPRNNYMAGRIIIGVSQPKVPLIGSGNQIQSYVDARDVARGIRLAAENKNTAGEAFNITSFQCDVKEYWLSAAEIMNNKIEFIHYPFSIAYFFGALSEFIGKITLRKSTPKATRFRVKYFGTTHIIDDSKIRKLLNFRPEFDLKTSMRDMLEDYIRTHTD